ncbi:hypothetical protein XELAEV_18006483mg [Xenopus laevis]|uniref:Uncharacterized protein n=1 Tax=Xenopus laevis TaxID=8355 RepID=A0A974DZP4_XENLA|nr:hypothetical protein XELAEV_18006483mg [Xenopus laevis]
MCRRLAQFLPLIVSLLYNKSFSRCMEITERLQCYCIFFFILMCNSSSRTLIFLSHSCLVFIVIRIATCLKVFSFFFLKQS